LVHKKNVFHPLFARPKRAEYKIVPNHMTGCGVVGFKLCCSLIAFIPSWFAVLVAGIKPRTKSTKMTEKVTRDSVHLFGLSLTAAGGFTKQRVNSDRFSSFELVNHLLQGRDSACK